MHLFSGDIRPGEFDLTNIPLPTGKGEVIIKARDINGRVETIVLPYYVTPQLLKERLKDYSYAIGMQRVGYGRSSTDKYKDFISNFDYSMGVTDNLTNSLHFESQKIVSAGNTIYYKLFNTIILNASIASNLKSNLNQAQRYSVGFDYINNQYSFNTTVAFGGRNFLDTYSKRYVNRGGVYTQSSAGYYREEIGNISINYLSYPVPTHRDMLKYGSVGINYDKKLSNNIYFRVNAGKNVRGPKNKFIIFSFNLNIDNNKYASFSGGQNNNKPSYNFAITSPVKGNIGYGYYAAFGKERENNYNIRVSKNTSKINSNLYLYQYGNSKVQQLNFGGSIVAIDNNIFLSQPILSSLALVKTGKIKNVSIYSNNQFSTSSNTKGLALVPNLPAYVKSTISLNENELPIECQIEENELHIIPKFKSASIVNFNLKQVKSLQMNLVDVHQKPVSYNMSVWINGIDEELFTGYNGLVYIKDIKDLEDFTGKACDANSCCYFNVSLRKRDEEIIDLGEVRCK